MTFDNSVVAAPSRWEVVKDNLPTVLMVGGAGAVFLSLHSGAYTVTAVGAALLVAGLVALAAGAVRDRKQAT